MKLNATKSSRDGSLACAKSLLFGASDFEHVLAAVEHLGDELVAREFERSKTGGAPPARASITTSSSLRSRRRSVGSAGPVRFC